MYKQIKKKKNVSQTAQPVCCENICKTKTKPNVSSKM
jgi:hypothetical protein